jgi:hypothetical protein
VKLLHYGKLSWKSCLGRDRRHQGFELQSRLADFVGPGFALRGFIATKAAERRRLAHRRSNSKRQPADKSEALEEPRIPKAALAGMPDCYKIKLRDLGYRLEYFKTGLLQGRQ